MVPARDACPYHGETTRGNAQLVLFKKRKPEQPVPDSDPQPPDDLRTAQSVAGEIPPQFRAMKRQLNSADVRTDRLVRQLRDEIDGVKTLLDQFADDQEELLVADPAAVADDPSAAASLPPTLLVRTIIALEEERADAASRALSLEQDVERLAAQIIELRLAEAGLRGRLQTYDDVIAALHGNLEDLRYARDQQASLQPEPARLRLKSVHDADEPPAAASAP